MCRGGGREPVPPPVLSHGWWPHKFWVNCFPPRTLKANWPTLVSFLAAGRCCRILVARGGPGRWGVAAGAGGEQTCTRLFTCTYVWGGVGGPCVRPHSFPSKTAGQGQFQGRLVARTVGLVSECPPPQAECANTPP